MGYVSSGFVRRLGEGNFEIGRILVGGCALSRLRDSAQPQTRICPISKFPSPATLLCFGCLSSGGGARPVLGFLQIAGSLVFRILWIRTHRTCETLRSSSHHLFGRDAFFDPFL